MYDALLLFTNRLYSFLTCADKVCVVFLKALDNARALRNQLKNIMIQNESKQPLSNVRALLQSIEQVSS